MLQKTINIQQGKEKPRSEDKIINDEFNDVFCNFNGDTSSVDKLKNIFGMK